MGLFVFGVFHFACWQDSPMWVSISLSIQFSHSVMSDSVTPWTAARQTSLSITDSRRWCHPTISFSVTSSLPAFSLSQHQGLFHWVSSSHRVAKVLEFQLQISPSNEYSGLISFKMDWLDLLDVQGTLKSLVQHHSLKASILWHSAFFMVQLSHPYMTTEKAIALTSWTFVGKVMSLLFKMLSRLVMAFLSVLLSFFKKSLHFSGCTGF